MGTVTGFSDDAFLAYAKQQEQAAAKRQSASTASREFEVITWSGLETNKVKVLRALGGVPDSNATNYTARSMRISRIVGDNGKQFRCVFPDRSEAPEHILWRILARINQVDWVTEGGSAKKVFPVKENYPAIFNQVMKNGVPSNSKRFIYERGWEGRHVLVMNIIDREMYDWHREHKHTALLSRSIGMTKKGVEIAEEGVPSYGFLGGISTLFRYYGSWEKYDIGIERTGLKELPYRITNASKHIEEIPAEMRPFVSTSPALTEEELSWQQYDLAKLFKHTSNTRLLNRLQGTIAKIDAVLGTSFLQELRDAAEAEKKLWAETGKQEEPDTDDATPVEEADEVVEEEVPVKTLGVSAAAVRPRSLVGEQLPPSGERLDTSLLKGWEKLSAAEKQAIQHVAVTKGKVTDITYKDKMATLYACPSCGIPAPSDFITCPNCAESFA